MKYIAAQPAIEYFGWQIDVMLHSFITAGVNLKDVHIVSSYNGELTNYFSKLIRKYPDVIFAFYKDTRKDKSYIPAIKQHLLYKHYLNNKYLENETIFLVDCDIALTKPIDFSNLLNDNIWYLSDTVSYLGYKYILSKGQDVLNLMAGIANMCQCTIKGNQENSGGAQYLLKNVKTDYWKEVEEMSCELYYGLSELEKVKKEKDPNYFPIQKWTSEMWAMLWVAWKKNIQTRVPKELDFLWATSSRQNWHTKSIYHNAGVTNSSSGMFFKGDYINKLPDLNLDISKNNCSYNYYKLIQQVLS